MAQREKRSEWSIEETVEGERETEDESTVDTKDSATSTIVYFTATVVHSSLEILSGHSLRTVIEESKQRLTSASIR